MMLRGQPKTLNHKEQAMDLKQIIHHSFVDTQRGTLRATAKAINKPYPTLMRELNANEGSAKLGAVTLLDLMKHTQNVEALQYMAEELGYTLTPLSQ